MKFKAATFELLCFFEAFFFVLHIFLQSTIFIVIDKTNWQKPSGFFLGVLKSYFGMDDREIDIPNINRLENY